MKFIVWKEISFRVKRKENRRREKEKDREFIEVKLIERKRFW